MTAARWNILLKSVSRAIENSIHDNNARTGIKTKWMPPVTYRGIHISPVGAVTDVSGILGTCHRSLPISGAL